MDAKIARAVQLQKKKKRKENKRKNVKENRWETAAGWAVANDRGNESEYCKKSRK